MQFALLAKRAGQTVRIIISIATKNQATITQVARLPALKNCQKA
jgi:hypothetical protein